MLSCDRNGPSKFSVVGLLNNYLALGQLHKVTVPTLIINGQYDEAADRVQMPFFKEIPKVKWVTIVNAVHVPWLEDPNWYFTVLASFLLS
jgi:pimeloyl-ACP methyl ester carboxylesterase